MEIWVLMNDAGELVVPGAKVVSFRGEVETLQGGRPPQHQGSTGRVWTDSGEFFPSVFGLTWRLVF